MNSGFGIAIYALHHYQSVLYNMMSLWWYYYLITIWLLSDTISYYASIRQLHWTLWYILWFRYRYRLIIIQAQSSMTWCFSITKWLILEHHLMTIQYIFRVSHWYVSIIQQSCNDEALLHRNYPMNTNHVLLFTYNLSTTYTHLILSNCAIGL